MLATVIRKEILEAMISFRFLIATLLCLVLIPLGMYVNLKDYQRRYADYQEAERLYQQRAEGNINWEFQAEGYRPPSILSIFSVGLEYFLPNKVITSRTGLTSTSNEQGINNPQSLLFGKVDLLFNVSFVISLLALIFSFNTISGEREDATLRLVMTNPIPRWQLLVGKVIGNYLVLLLPFLLSILVALLIISVTGIIPMFSPAIFPAFVITLLCTLVFLLAMFLLGVLVSALTHRSITSIVALLFIWALLVLSLPKISPMLAEILYPVKSPQVITLQEMLIRQNLAKELDTKRRALYDRTMAAFGFTGRGVSVPGRTEAERNAQASYDQAKKPLEDEYQGRISDEIKKLRDDYSSRRETQARLAMNLSRISPVSCYTYVVCELSSTGILEMDNFRSNAERYQTEVDESIYDKFIIHSYGGAGGGTATSINEAEGFEPRKAPVPQMNYHRLAMAEILHAEWIDLFLLCVFTVALFAASYVSFLRYDVR